MVASGSTRFPFCFPLLILGLFTSVNGLLELRTIDDAAGDSADPNVKPVFLPDGTWSQRPNPCSGCNLNPNAELAFNRTWHDTTHMESDPTSSVQLSFTGIALSVFCILPPKTAQAITPYDLTFILDGQPVGPPFTRTTDQLTDSYQYNVTVFSMNDLQNKKHTFIMQMANKTISTVALFDYASYIYNDQGIISEETGKKLNLGAILGGVLGAIAFLAGAAFLFLYARRRRTEVRILQGAQADPFDSVSVTRTEPLPNKHRRNESLPSSPCPAPGSSTLDTEKGPPPAYSQ
ncbi:hypothetical protein E1B28_007373 [Marasmius oreades]|nr:uncharacterized protein E1B28_007373 [Marasmius oreades]KAG7093719.1 hypothetical protein E1B28_007373 [Marasmius oreades]